MTGSDRAGEGELVDRARRFARDVIAPNAARWELERRPPADLMPLAAAAGLTGIMVPVEHGGQGADVATVAAVMEELARVDLAVAFSLVVHNNLMRSVAMFGSDEQRRRYLAPLAAGEIVGAFLLTEPSTGSDAAAIATEARPDGDGWVINGEKAWVTNAATAGLLSVYAQTDPSRGWRGIACFLVETAAAGVDMTGPYELLGAHAMGTGGFRFRDCRVPGSAMMLAPEQGFKAAMNGIDVARIMVAAMGCGILQTCLDTAVAYGRERRAFGAPVADNQGYRWQLADVATDLHAARLMTAHAAETADRGGAAAIPAAHAKKFVTRAALAGVTQCMQAMGAAGLRHDFPFARHLAGAKVAQYLDGATEIQNIVIARALFSA